MTGSGEQQLRESLVQSIEARGGQFVEKPGGGPHPQESTLHVIGFVLWDRPEVQALKQLAGQDGTGLVLFDLDDFFTQEAIEETFPGFNPVLRAPAWANVRGKLSWQKQGKEALDWLSASLSAGQP